ncbi:MAG: tetratricopeptide repeat protein [Planctomycetes bacterium]|nr:tetratricopeptide repeat protein [Planctomycetota bacterium]
MKSSLLACPALKAIPAFNSARPSRRPFRRPSRALPLLRFAVSPAFTLAFAFAFSLFLAGCRSAAIPGARPGADPLYAEAESAYLAGNYASARAAYSRFLATPPAPPFAPEVRLRIAACYLREGQPALALPELDRGLRDAAFPWLSGELLAATGDAHRLLGDLKRAENAYRRALEAGAHDIREAEVRRNLAGVLARQGRWDEARAEFAQIAARFPSSPHAPVAAERAALGDRTFWVQLGLFEDAALARRRCQEASAKGVRVNVTPLLADRHAAQAVRLGPFDTWTAAEAAAQNCRTRGLEAAVVP